MAYQPLNLGDGISREPLGSALKKVDTMISELYTTIPEGDFSAVSQNIVPAEDIVYNLGSPTNRWHSLYVGSGSVYIGDAKLSATTTGAIILPGVYDPSGHQAVEVYPKPGIDQDRTWGAPQNVKLIDAFTWAAQPGQPDISIPAGWARATYSASLNNEGYISSVSVLTGGNEYSDTDINGVNDVATICADYMYVYIGLSADPFAVFVPSDWTQVPFAVRCQATSVVLSATIGESVSYTDLTDLPDQNLNTTDSVEFLGVTTGSINELEFVSNIISNLNVVGSLSAGSQIQVGNGTAADTGIIISNGTADGLLSSRSLINVNGNNASMMLQIVNSLSEGGPSLTGQQLVEVGPSSVLIGIRVINDSGDSSTPEADFRGWTFDSVSDELYMPPGGTIKFDNGTLAVGSYTRNINDPFAINVADTAGSITLNWGVNHGAYSNKIILNNNGVKLTTNTTKDFVFGTDGSVTLPNNSIINAGSAANGQASVGWKEFLAGPTIGWGLYAENDIYIQTFNDITKPTWVFKENGTTRLPGFTFPATDGTVGQVLATNGSGTLAWTTITGGGGGTDISTASINDLADVTVSSPVSGQVLKWNGSAWINDTDANSGGGGAGTLSTRTTRSVTTSSIANLAAATATITGFTGYALLSIQTSAAAWVTVYTSSAARTSDAGRVITDDPVPGSGVLAEVITTGAQTQVFTPGVFGYNDETIPTTDIQIKVVNRSGSTAAITVTVKLLQLEA